MQPAYNHRVCAVCGDTPAKIHYGVLACFGCKGFFRRAVKDGRNKYVCRFEKNCEVTKFERNACRYCRFRKCLLVGMNPDFVRPDREEKSEKTCLSKKKSLGRTTSHRGVDGDWTSLLPQPQKRLLMQLSRLESEAQANVDGNFDGVADFSLKSLIADRTLARKNQAPDTSCSSAPRPFGAERFLSIGRIVRCIDFVDRFIGLLEEEHSKRIGIEDKSALISSIAVHLLAVESTAKFCSKGVANIDDFKHTFQDFPMEQSLFAKLSDVCEMFKRRAPSTVEYTIINAYVVTTAESTMLSNTLNEMLTAARENLSELLFKVVKSSRVKNSLYAANYMSNLLHFVYESRELSSSLSRHLSMFFPRDAIKPMPFQHIFTDVVNPELSDLLLTIRKPSMSSQNMSSQNISPNMSSTMPNNMSNMNAMNVMNMPPPVSIDPLMPSVSNFQFSPPSLSPPQVTVSMPPHQTSSFSPYSPAPTFAQRPTTLQFPKIPLTMTKSIEEMLRPPGMLDDANIMNRPLARDWADGIRLTPVFNKDIVAQFFPELTASHLGT